MIIVNLKGGTGNQLFQYALGRHLAIKNNTTLTLDSDGLARANITGDIYRPLAIDAFATEKKIASNEEVRKLKYPYGIVSKIWRWCNFRILRNTNIVFSPSVLTWSGDIYLDGYWQSPLYFNDIREVLLREFSLVAPFSKNAAPFAEKIKNTTAVSIHVRRGDYIKNPTVLKEFGVCSLSYYHAAITYIQQSAESPTFFIFSDDIAWVKENLPVGENAVFVYGEGIRDVEELTLMRLCTHNIIANSSFSWWGAWLNEHPNKIVIAPTPWFELATYDQHLIPDTWIQLPK
jgi:hypothetical protein